MKMAGETPHPRPLSHWERGDLDPIEVGVRAGHPEEPVPNGRAHYRKYLLGEVSNAKDERRSVSG